MQIYIRRDNEEFGPYSREAALEYVKQGIFKSLDDACYAGMTDWKPVGELLGIRGDTKSARGRTATQITEFNPSWVQTSVHRLPRRTGKNKSSTMIFLNLVLILIVAGAAYARWGTRSYLARQYLEGFSAELAKLSQGDAAQDKPAMPAPAAAAPGIANPPDAAPSSSPGLVATPAVAPPSAPDAASPPSITTASPEASGPAAGAASTPAPVAVSAPAPPKPFDPAVLAGNPDAWPKTVRLKQAVAFPVVIDSQVAGSVTVPPGTVVNLTGIQGDQLTLQYQGQTQTLPWNETDIQEQVAKSSSSVAPPAPSAPSWPAASAPGATASAAAGTPLGN